jgi:hypothetical protein
MKVTRRMIVIPVATLMAAGIGAGAFAVGLTAARAVPEAVTADTTFNVSMDGIQEVTAAGVGGAGDLDGAGFATVTIDTATDEVCVDVSFFDVDPINLMHIHRGVAGTNGPVVVDFAPTPGPGPFEICVPGGAVADEIAANPLSFYLNAHTTPFPAGAVRGQLEPGFVLTHLLPTPVRVYDSRQPNSQGSPALAALSTTVIDLSAAGPLGALPPGATGALVNITVTDTIASGFLTVYSNALATAPATSTVNWVLPLEDVAVQTPVKVDATGSVKVTVGPNGSTDLIIDVIGYLSSTGGVA